MHVGDSWPCIMFKEQNLYVPWSKVAILGMVIPPLIGILIGYINPYGLGLMRWPSPIIWKCHGSWDLDQLSHMSSMIPTTYLEICFAKTKATPLFSNVQRRVKGLELTSGTTLRIMTEKNTGEQRSKPVNDTSLYWLVYRDPYNGFWNNPYITG